MFGRHVEILDFALHVDEAIPHIHERHVFHCKNKYGELCPQQEKAITVLQKKVEVLEEKRNEADELMDAGFPTNIRSHVWEVFNKIFEVVRKPVEAIVEQVRYDFKRSFTEYYQKERIQEKIWEHIENKAEQDVKQGQEESLVSQLVRRRRGR